jgi:hypothetical protein
MTQPTPPALPAPEPQESGFNLRRIVLIAAGGLIGLIVVLFIVALLLSGLSDVEGAGEVVRLVRDLVIIFLAVEGVLIVLALAILVLQLARLINLIQTEIKPILENTQETVKTAQGTVEFMSNNLTEPIVRASGFMAGMSVLMTQLFGIRRALQRNGRGDDGEAG